MTIASYSDLLTEMGNWLNRTDLAAEIPTFIQLFETRMNRRLRNPDQQITTTQTITGATYYPILPPMRQVKHVHIAGTPRIELAYMTHEEWRIAYPNDDSGDAQAYTIVGNSIYIQPIPTSGSIVLIGYNTLAALGTGNTTNWLLNDHPDAYLFGSLCEAAAYLRDDERLTVWKSAWEEVLGEIEAEANARRIPAGPLFSRAAVWE